MPCRSWNQSSGLLHFNPEHPSGVLPVDPLVALVLPVDPNVRQGVYRADVAATPSHGARATTPRRSRRW